MMNRKFKYLPAGPRVMVLLDEAKKEFKKESGGEIKTTGGIIIPEKSEEYQLEKRRDEAVEAGELVCMGNQAFKNIEGCDGTPWAKIGDRVLFPAYAGRKYKNPFDDRLYRIMADQDIFGIESELNEQEIENESR